jgi:hypothetical protein
MRPPVLPGHMNDSLPRVVFRARAALDAPCSSCLPPGVVISIPDTCAVNCSEEPTSPPLERPHASGQRGSERACMRKDGERTVKAIRQAAGRQLRYQNSATVEPLGISVQPGGQALNLSAPVTIGTLNLRRINVIVRVFYRKGYPALRSPPCIP